VIATGKPLIELRGVVKEFQTAAGIFTALKHVDLTVGAGEFVAVVGKSGSGKSTLINMVTGIDRPTSGEVIVAGTHVHRLSESRMAEWRGRNLGIIFQFFQLLPGLSVIENVMLPMDFCRMYAPRERPRRALGLLAQVDMADQAHKLPASISGGQQQRVAIARALANDPPILVADEPTGNLDSRTAESVFQLFERLVAGGKTIVMVTHDNDLAKRVTRAIIVSDGEIVNPAVARALSSLGLEQLSWVTQALRPIRFSPGATIVRQGDHADAFYIVTAGRVEVVRDEPGRGAAVVRHLTPGEYFGEVGLLQNGRRIASVRASTEGPVDVVALDRDEFLRLLDESAVTRDEMESRMRARVDEILRAAPDARP
jgi:ABC-type lipoprotein export system ATPase subunit